VRESASNAPTVPPKAWLKKRLYFVDTVQRALNWKGTVAAQIGDEVWSFTSPGWEEEAGEMGQSLIRNGQPIDGFVIAVS